jgi:hypothetical protein
MIPILLSKARLFIARLLDLHTEQELEEVRALNNILLAGVQFAGRHIPSLQYALRQAEAEVEISRNLLSKCSEVRDELRIELSLVTTERDNALVEIEDLHMRLGSATAVRL